ncbi:hypothetical protein N8E87_02910 [Avibacterium paragallinarum]|uniref:hypothetical protein n=1 Tax=Avibacterium paragallinarum TaxID=728 RepID=UPI0021F6C74B|nr:hypothetical protein [Avibacterium paragallinarum]UXN37440.1 hypothetical protein N8E87_02910 [Avibacterium paragallinarum]
MVFEGYFCIWKNQENGFKKYRTFIFVYLGFLWDIARVSLLVASFLFIPRRGVSHTPLCWIFYLQNTVLLFCHFWIFGLMTFFFGSYNGFRSLSDLLSFAFPKESKQRKGNLTKLLFLIPIKFSSRKVSLMFASLSLGVTFLKILFPFGQFTRERAIFKSAVVFEGYFCIWKNQENGFRKHRTYFNCRCCIFNNTNFS